MSKENLIYNCSGSEYWEKLYNDNYRRLCLYEGHHGGYVGEIHNGIVYNSKTGEYLGEIYKNRLIVDNEKIDNSNYRIQGNFMFHPSSRMGHACIPSIAKIQIPVGYEDFTVGI